LKVHIPCKFMRQRGCLANKRIKEVARRMDLWLVLSLVLVLAPV
jgi:hypothetical protein